MTPERIPYRPAKLLIASACALRYSKKMTTVVQANTHLRTVRGITFIGFVVATCAGLVSCGGDSGSTVNPVGPTSPVAQQSGPDLVVGLPSVSDSSPAAGAPFTLTVAVRNDGNAASVATMLRYYQSPDPAITESDTAVGTAAVAGLSAARTLSESVELSAPSTPGTYYYGACVDAVAGEPDTTNNCSTSVQVEVSEPEPAPTPSPTPEPEPEPEPEPSNPDLVVGLPSVSNSGPAAEASFTLSATVRNGGDGASAATTLRFYRSTDRAITESDTQVGMAAMAELTASGSRSESVELTAPSAPGTYYYGACVDAVAEESDTTNNCSASMEVNVLETLEQTQGSPDLTVGSPTVSNSGPAAGETFTLSATVGNAGDGESATTTLQYYQSTDGTITTSDTAVGTDAVAVLGASGSSSVSVDLTAPSSPGTYYYGACVDAVTDESDTANNCAAAVQVTVPEPGATTAPDLVVDAPTVNDNNPATGAPFTLSATVRNAGDGESAATTLRVYQSTDETITTADAEVGTAAVGGLAASATSSESISLTAPSTAGTYYYGACVDAVTDESDTTNNCAASVTVTVPEPPTSPVETQGSGPRGEPRNEPVNRPRAACTLVYNYHDSSAYDGPLGHYVYATDGAGYTPSTAQAGYIGAFIHLDLSGDCSGGSSADRTALYSLAKPNSFSYLRYDHYAEWSPGGSGSWLQNVEDYGAIQGRHYYIIERSGDGELVDPVTKMWVRVILFGTNGGTQKRGRMGWAGSAAGMPDITITWNGLDSFLIPPRPPRPTPRVECVEGCIVQQGGELELRLVLDEPLIPGLPKLLRPRFDPPTIFREVTGRTQRDNWRECGIGQTDRAECLWRVKQTSGPGSLLGGSSYSFLWEAPRDPGSHKIKIGYEYKAWGSFKEWGYRDTAFEGVDVTVTVPPPRADRGPVTTPLVCAPLIPPDTGWPCSVKINAEDEIPSRKRDLAIAEFMITAHDPEGDPIAYRWETHDRGVQTVTSLTPAEILELDPSGNSTSGSKLSWNMQGLDPRIYPVTVSVLDTPYRLGTGITATLHVENFVPNAAPAISLICAPRFQPQSGASNPCTATLDTPAIGSDGARIDFGAVVTDPENDSFTVAWTASAGSLSTSSGTNTTWNGSTLTAGQSATVTATATDSDGAASTATDTVHVLDYVSGGGTGPTTPEPPQPPQVDGDCAARDLTKTEFLPGELYCGQLHNLTEAWTHYARAPRSTGDTVADGILVFTSYNRICAYIGSCRATESDDEVHTSGTSTYQWITVR